LIAVVVLSLAAIGLVGWLISARGRRGRQDAQQAPDDGPDVELAVRERLYGSRPRPG
jgi:hypothetical protein